MAKRVLVVDDTDILTARAAHPDYGTLRFERASQDRRVYYRLLIGSSGMGSLNTAKSARENIAYWCTKGWLVGESS